MGFGHCAYVSLLESSHVVPLFHLSHERTPWLVIGRPVLYPPPFGGKLGAIGPDRWALAANAGVGRQRPPVR